jgi:7,8-dihydropterin-6-yl-methyl-4-(beta-D-ribofuranosyl)aminobenzene 5'-phosphate synthase
MKIDPAQVDALILSHGHFDHYGGLIGFLEARREHMRKDLRLYTGGEDIFCQRVGRSRTAVHPPVALDRRRLKALNVETGAVGHPAVIEGHALRPGRCRAPASSTYCRTAGSKSASRTVSGATPTPI